MLLLPLPPNCKGVDVLDAGLPYEIGARASVELPADEPERFHRRVEPSDSVMGRDDLVAPFGPVLAVPTLMTFRPDGTIAEVFYGAPPDLHDRVKRVVSELGR